MLEPGGEGGDAKGRALRDDGRVLRRGRRGEEKKGDDG
jgi:hypothetical protein